MFIAAVFTTAMTWEQPKCLMTDERIKKMWCIYIYRENSATKRKKMGVICKDVDGPRVCYTERRKSEREKQILYINAYMWNLEKGYR